MYVPVKIYMLNMHSGGRNPAVGRGTAVANFSELSLNC